MVESERLPACRANVANATSKAGSANAEKKTSRLAPMPSNDEPVSSAARTVKNRINASRQANKKKSAGKRDSAREISERHQRDGHQHRRQPEHRSGAKEPGSCAAINRALVQQFPQIEIGLQERLAAPPANSALVRLMMPSSSGASTSASSNGMKECGVHVSGISRPAAQSRSRRCRGRKAARGLVASSGAWRCPN